MNTAILSVMHFFVDFICAWAMFGRFPELGYESYLIYNFCAFALQMPFGTLLDLLGRRKRNFPLACTALGLVLTCAGALTHPAVLGVGNALFHVGGGMDVILEDFRDGKKGRELGVFVAPGAVGLLLGTRLGKAGTGGWILFGAAVLMAALSVPIWMRKGNTDTAPVPCGEPGKGILILGTACFVVVILRSFVGMSVSFSWKTGAVYPLMAVFAVALGKLCGGLLAARFGCVRTAGWSLMLAAVCFLLGESPAFGLAALFLFNISMPVTLYLLAEKLPGLPGFSFGLLTFGLFIGFLPVYAGVALPMSGCTLGALGSMLSALILIAAGKVVGKVSVSA